MERSAGIVRTVILQLLRQDLLATVITTVLWSMLGLADPRVLVGLAIVRTAIWVSYVHWRFAPVRAWEQATAANEAELLEPAQLLEAAQLLFRFRQLLLPKHVAMWTAALTIGSLVQVFDHTGALTVGRAELVFLGLLLGSVSVALVILEGMIIDGAMLEGVRRISVELGKAGLQVERDSTPLGRRMIVVLLGLSLLISMLLSTVGVSYWIDHVRELELAEQQRRAELAALHVAHGELGRVDPDLELLATHELPAALQPLDVGAETRLLETRLLIDPAHERVLAAAPVGDGRWVVAIGHPEEHLGRTVLIVLVVLVIVIARASTAARMLSRMQVTQIDSIGATMRKVIESGNMLGGERVVMLENDEAGQLGELFNRMLDMLAELAKAAEAVAAGDLRVALERPGDLYDSFRVMLRNLREIVGEIRRTSVELASTAAELHAMTNQQQGATEQQSERMRAVVQMLGVLATSADEMAEVANTVLDNADQTAAVTDEATQKITELGRETQKIGELLALIREVADRSDLLALNGALEATRAGEAGRGFELVAAEMRRLAERVARAVDEVAGRVAEIDRASAPTIAATRESRQLAQGTAGAAKLISAVSQIQRQDTQALVTTVDATHDAMEATVASLQQTLVAVGDIRHEAERLEQLTRQFVV